MEKLVNIKFNLQLCLRQLQQMSSLLRILATRVKSDVLGLYWCWLNTILLSPRIINLDWHLFMIVMGKCKCKC